MNGRKAKAVRSKAIDALNEEIGKLQAALTSERTTIRSLEVKLDFANLQRVVAQRSLIEDIRTPCYSCGQPWRPPHQRAIAYNPDADAEVQRAIIDGKIPANNGRIKTENATLRAALEEQWEEAHFDHCGRLHGPEKTCMWPKPAILEAVG